MTLLSNDRGNEQFSTCLLHFLINVGKKSSPSPDVVRLLDILFFFLKVGENSNISAERENTALSVFGLSLNLPLGLNGNHALLAEAHPLHCHPTKHCQQNIVALAKKSPCQQELVPLAVLQKVMIVTHKLLTG